MVNDDNLSTGGFSPENLPAQAQEVKWPSTFTEEDIENVIEGLAALIYQVKRVADVLEKQARYQKDSAVAMKKMVVEVQKHKRK